MRMRPVLLAVLLPQALSAQSEATLAGVIVSRQTREPLAHSIVTIVPEGPSQFTNDSGVFVFRQLSAGPVQLRVRRLGYAPFDTTVIVRGVADETVRLAIPRVAVTLASVTVQAFPACTTPGAPRAEDDSTLAATFVQLRLNAEQFRLLTEQYPFAYEMQTTKARKHRQTGQTYIVARDTLRFERKARSSYRPGQVIARRGTSYFVAIPTLIEIGDPAFVRSHCFHNGGMETLDDGDFLRMDLVASEAIKSPDVNGSILLDPETFQIRRTVLRLSRRPDQIRDLVDMEITTDFEEVMTSIPIISHVFSVQTMDTQRKLAFDVAYEEHRLLKFEFLFAKPGAEKKPPR